MWPVGTDADVYRVNAMWHVGTDADVYRMIVCSVS